MYSVVVAVVVVVSCMCVCLFNFCVICVSVGFMISIVKEKHAHLTGRIMSIVIRNYEL
jgi:hypothetical protein